MLAGGNTYTFIQRPSSTLTTLPRIQKTNDQTSAFLFLPRTKYPPSNLPILPTLHCKHLSRYYPGHFPRLERLWVPGDRNAERGNWLRLGMHCSHAKSARNATCILILGELPLGFRPLTCWTRETEPATKYDGTKDKELYQVHHPRVGPYIA